MLIKKMVKFITTILFLAFFVFGSTLAETRNESFSLWLEDFKKRAVIRGISEATVENALSEAIFLPKVIEYDRFQPEFYEDTYTYIKKRTSSEKVRKGIRLYKKEEKIINQIEKIFLVEKELLIALMGIETNFGKYLGKMDIISSLATLSYDKRRSEFFSNELLILLELLDKKIIDKKILYGSWAGAFGNFQFMPSTIMNYAIDYNKNSDIELKKIEDSFASAANYISKIGWKKNEPCFDRVQLKKDIPKKYLNTSAKKLKNKVKLRSLRKYLKDNEPIRFKETSLVAVITPDKDIVPNSDNLSPAFIVSGNYEQILKWNRSLRFALAVCTLKEKIRNEL